MNKKVRLYQGDNIQSLKKLPDNSIDSIVTDPPYALTSIKKRFGKEGSAPAQYGTDGVFQRASKGFMGKEWDAELPSVEFWKEVYRVLKPGGHVLSFGGTRTYHRMVVNMEDAGFEIRDQIQWIYSTGFPKSHNIGKAVDKIEGNEREVVGTKISMAPPEGEKKTKFGFDTNFKPTEIELTKGSSEFEGWGTALKPANEPICVARKPLSEKSVAENVIKWGTGGINIDGCRIGTTDYIGRKGNDNDLGVGILAQFDGRKTPPQRKSVDKEGHDEGRFPANIILECCCDEVIEGEVKKSNRRFEILQNKSEGKVERIENYGDKGDIHTNPECPCYIMDQQSGESKSSKSNKLYVNDTEGRSVKNGASGFRDPNSTYSDKGGASRFFYQAKVSKAERNMGLDGFEEKTTGGKGHGLDRRCSHCNTSMLKPEDCNCDEPNWITPPKKNNHPTIKPINLMTYLCRLITPPNGIVLDPFMGSGSTGIAAQLEGFRFVGMEMDEDYFKIAEARIENFQKYKKFIK